MSVLIPFTFIACIPVLVIAVPIFWELMGKGKINIKFLDLRAKVVPLNVLIEPSPWQKPLEDMTFVVLEEVDVEVDWGVDDSEKVGKVGGVLHPGGPH